MHLSRTPTEKSAAYMHLNWPYSLRWDPDHPSLSYLGIYDCALLRGSILLDAEYTESLSVCTNKWIVQVLYI